MKKLLLLPLMLLLLLVSVSATEIQLNSALGNYGDLDTLSQTSNYSLAEIQFIGGELQGNMTTTTYIYNTGSIQTDCTYTSQTTTNTSVVNWFCMYDTTSNITYRGHTTYYGGNDITIDVTDGAIPPTCYTLSSSCTPCSGGYDLTHLNSAFLGYNWTTDVNGYGDITGWDTSCITSMTRTFQSSDFNQDISGWDTSKVTTMLSLFNGASVFNQPIGIWDTGNVTTFANMFYNAVSFNQDISSWDTSSATFFTFMFNRASSFNQDISAWDTGNVTNFLSMFAYAVSFNQDISAWDTSSATSFNGMFNNAVSFNQDISGWTTGKVTNTAGMFSNAVSFNQNLGSWDMRNVTNAVSMFNDVTLSTSNYDAILSGWSSQVVKSGVTFSGGNSLYTDVTSRNILTDTYSWTITDGGLFIETIPAPYLSTPCNESVVFYEDKPIYFNWSNSTQNSSYTLAKKSNILYTDVFTTSYTDYTYEVDESAWTTTNYTLKITATLDNITNSSSTCWLDVCIPNWNLSVQPCINGVVLKDYYDTNYCGYVGNIPLDNGTYAVCETTSVIDEKAIDKEMFLVIFILFALFGLGIIVGKLFFVIGGATYMILSFTYLQTTITDQTLGLLLTLSGILVFMGTMANIIFGNDK